jgi:hypothetical protein
MNPPIKTRLESASSFISYEDFLLNAVPPELQTAKEVKRRWKLYFAAETAKRANEQKLADEYVEMSFGDFLRDVIGAGLASARTETDRMRYLRQFLDWWKRCQSSEKHVELCRCWLKHAPRPFDLERNKRIVYNAMYNPYWTPEGILIEKRRTGFTHLDVYTWRWLFTIWTKGRFKRRARLAARARWKKENAQSEGLTPISQVKTASSTVPPPS